MEIRITRRNRDVVSDTRYKPFGCGESCNANISMPYFLCKKPRKPLSTIVIWPAFTSKGLEVCLHPHIIMDACWLN